MSQASIGTNTDLTHSPRYKPFSTLVFAVWDPLRAHERDGTIARRYDHSDLNRDRKKNIYMDPPCSITERVPLSFIFFLSAPNASTIRRYFFLTLLRIDLARARARYIDHSYTYTWDIMVIDRLSLT